MLKKITLFLLAALTLIVPGCAKNTTDILDYQTKNFTAAATLQVNGEDFTVTVKKTGKDNYTLTYDSPANIKGVGIEKNGDGLYFSAGSVHIPLKTDSNITASALNLFSLLKKDLTSLTEESLGGVKVEKGVFNTSFGAVTLYVSKETSLPIIIEADIKGNDVVISFSSFEITENETK